MKGREPEGFVPVAAHTFRLPAMSHLGTPCGGTLLAHHHTSLQDCCCRVPGAGNEATLPNVQLSGLTLCCLIRSWRTSGTGKEASYKQASSLAFKKAEAGVGLGDGVILELFKTPTWN